MLLSSDAGFDRIKMGENGDEQQKRGI